MDSTVSKTRTQSCQGGAAVNDRSADAPVRRVHGVLDSARSRRPDAPAIRDASGVWNYAELTEASLRYAAWLHRRGVRSGDRVAVRAWPDRRVIALLFACSRIGATFVPIAAGIRDQPLHTIVHDAEPAAVFLDAADLVVPEIPSDSVPNTAGRAFAASSADPPAFLIYTSGSTSAPKAVVCPHSAVLFAASAIAERLCYRHDDVILCRLPLSFDYGLYQALLAALSGAELVLSDPRRDAALLAQIRVHNVTVVPLVPSLATLLLRLAERDREPTRLRLFTNTGEHLSPAVVNGLRSRFPTTGIQLMFGITECKRVSILEVDGDTVRPGSVGTPLRGTRVRIIDADGAELPVGEVGEIVVSGPHVMAGYWRAPELTSRFFRPSASTREPELFTGDFGRLDEDGHLFFIGRRDDIFKMRGTRTSVTEIEAAAHAVAGVTEAAVAPPSAEYRAILYVAGSVEPTEVLRALRGRIDPLKVPDICRLIERIPRSTTGKVDRGALQAFAHTDGESLCP